MDTGSVGSQRMVYGGSSNPSSNLIQQEMI